MIPRKYLVIGVASIGLNVLAGLYVALIVYANNSHELDYATANTAIEVYCSDEFRQTVERSNKESGVSENEAKKNLALVDYPCTRNGAGPYYEKGFNEYAQSVGITLAG